MKGGFYIKTEDCIGCGLCETLYPEVFKLNEQEKSEVIGKYIKEVDDIIEQCPTQCIYVE